MQNALHNYAKKRCKQLQGIYARSMAISQTWNSLLIEFGGTLHKKMKEAGISRSDFCHEMELRGMSPRAAANFWRGTPDIRISTLQMILEATGAKIRIECTDQTTSVEFIEFNKYGYLANQWRSRWYAEKQKRKATKHIPTNWEK